MNARPLACPRCAAPLTGPLEELNRLERCAQCGAALDTHVFPALFRTVPVGSPAVPIVDQGEAGCFYHPQKRAVSPCDGCGRFLCALCDLELGGTHLCPACLEAGTKSGRLVSLANRRTLYDGAALSLAVWPILLWPVTLITAPAVLWLVIFRWKSPGSIVGRGKIRFVLAMTMALLQLAGWGIVFWVLLNR